MFQRVGSLLTKPTSMKKFSRNRVLIQPPYPNQILCFSGKSEENNKKQKKQELQRIDRILTNRGVGTRSQMSKLLRQKGRVCIVTESNEEIFIKSASEKIPVDSHIRIDGEFNVDPLPLLMVFHKPKNVLSAMKSKGQDLSDHLPIHLHDLMHPVGRLDLDSSGLLLFSRQGDLTQRLLHPRHQVEKEYVATVEGKVIEEDLRESLMNGVNTTEGTHVADLLGISKPSLLNSSLTDVRLVVTEGKHRMVRRMLANLGHPVIELRRERYGNIQLGELAEGEFRNLNGSEKEWALSLLA